MTLSLIFLTLAGLFLLFKKLEGKIRSVTGWQKHTEERISTLESNDFQREGQLSRHTTFIKKMRRDLNTLGRDVGWSDDLHKTQTLEKKPDKPDDNPT